MAAMNPGAFSSSQFVFVVGETQKEFPIHSAIIAKQSKALDALMTGPMVEASDGRAIFKDTEEETFERFCQFAYSGDYSTPDFALDTSIRVEDCGHPPPISDDNEPVPEPEPEAMAGDVPVEMEEDVEPSWGSKSKSKKVSKSRLLRQSLDGLVYKIDGIRRSFKDPCEVRQNTKPTENYTPVLLYHAQLYVFAEKWGIEDLKDLTLFKLHQTLVSFTLYETRRGDIVELLRYTYSNDNTPDLKSPIDDLRALVMMYVGCEVESLVRCPKLLTLIGEGGPLAQDLVRMMMRRIGQ